LASWTSIKWKRAEIIIHGESGNSEDDNESVGGDVIVEDEEIEADVADDGRVIKNDYSVEELLKYADKEDKRLHSVRLFRSNHPLFVEDHDFLYRCLLFTSIGDVDLSDASKLSKFLKGPHPTTTSGATTSALLCES
jgi:hypothetical protein